VKPIGAILVGGASSRLGRDKALVRVGGRTLVERAESALLAVVDQVVVVGKAGTSCPLPGRRWVTDDRPGRSALAGLCRALAAAEDRPVLVVACDHPFLAPPLLRLLLDGLAGEAACVPGAGGRLDPLVAAYDPRRIGSALEGRLARGELRLSSAVLSLRPRVLADAELRAVDPGLVSFLNVNEPADLERARALGEKV
jgi:molybdopterin-guanine dinucleotide biosynthesis protein A